MGERRPLRVSDEGQPEFREFRPVLIVRDEVDRSDHRVVYHQEAVDDREEHRRLVGVGGRCNNSKLELPTEATGPAVVVSKLLRAIELCPHHATGMDVGEPGQEGPCTNARLVLGNRLEVDRKNTLVTVGVMDVWDPES